MSMQPVLPLPVILRPYGLVPVPGESWQALPSASGNSVWAVDTGTGKIVVRCNEERAMETEPRQGH